MSSIVSGLLVATVATLATLALPGCRVGTEYVPQAPGRATIGMERNEVGLYKNGAFVLLGDSAAEMLRCSAPAATAVREASTHQLAARSYGVLSSIGSALLAFFPPLVGVGLGFGALAERESSGSFAYAVDAVNMHNDTTGCISASNPGVHP